MTGRGIGAALFILGGGAEIVRVLATHFATQSFAAPPVVVAAITLGPSLVIALGAVTVGVSFRGRARLAFLLMGVFGLLAVAVNVIQIVLGSPLGPAPSQLAAALSFLATLAGAVLLLTDRATRTPARWALALPAGAILVLVAGMSLIPWDAWFALPAIGYVCGGSLLVVPAGRGFADPTPSVVVGPSWP